MGFRVLWFWGIESSGLQSTGSWFYVQASLHLALAAGVSGFYEFLEGLRLGRLGSTESGSC